MDDLDPAARVLVAIVTRPRDLAAAREAGWYRIPMARAPAAIDAEYLAFYQTAAFGEERWAVRYYAAVRAVTLAARAELLPDEPAHPRAAQRYYRFALGPLWALAAPVPSQRLRRLSFIATTAGQLLAARDVGQLWQPGPAEQASWGELWGAGVNRR